MRDSEDEKGLIAEGERDLECSEGSVEGVCLTRTTKRKGRRVHAEK